MEALPFFLKYKEIIFPFIPAFLVGVAALFYAFRAGDFKALSDRIWRVLAGPSFDSKGVVDGFIDETRNIERIRFVYGIRVKSNHELLKLRHWIESNNLTMTGLRGCFGFVRIADRVSIDRPSGALIFGFIFISILYYIFIIGFLYLSISNDVYITTKETKIWARASRDRISSSVFSTKGWSFGAKDCKDDRRLLKTLLVLVSGRLDLCVNILGKNRGKGT